MKVLSGSDATAALYRVVNHTDSRVPCASIKELFESQVTRSPDATAVVFGDEEVSYGLLNALSDDLAARLTDDGIGPGSTVGIGLSRSIELIVALIAAAKCGAPYVPVDLSWPERVLDGVIADSATRILLTGVDDVAVGRGTPVRRVTRAARGASSVPEQRAAKYVSSEGLAYIAFTSGSTGRPKGVRVPQRGVVRLVCDATYADLDDRAVILHLAPVTFDAATFEIWGPLLNGGKCVIYPERRISFSGLAKVIDETGVTCVFLTTALFNAVVADAPKTLERVRTILFGGEECSPTHVRAALKQYGPGRIVHVYGPTECTTFATYYRIDSLPEPCTAIPIGRPIQNTRLYVVDGDTLCGPSQAGEIVLAGPGVADGYAGSEAAQSQFDQWLVNGRSERVYRTGDLGHLSEDGNLIFDGRADDQVKINGFRIELPAILRALNDSTLVSQCYVTASEGVAGERRVVAFIVPADAVCDLRELRDQLRLQLPSYMVPASMYRRDELPMLPSGKIDRKALLASLKLED